MREGLGMEGDGIEEHPVFEIGVVVPKRDEKQEFDNAADCIEVLEDEFRKMGLIVERVVGLQNEFLKVYSNFLFFPVPFANLFYVVAYEYSLQFYYFEPFLICSGFLVSLEFENQYNCML